MADSPVAAMPVSVSPTRKRKKLQLTSRDKQLLRFLAEYGCVAASHIKQRFWNDNPRSRAHYRRIGILKRAGWIEIVYGDLGVGLGYRLSKGGRLRFRREFPGVLVFAPVRRAYKTSLEHDQLLIDIRQIFTQSPLVREFKSESKVARDLLSKNARGSSWAKQPLLPDAMFTFEAPGNRLQVGLELELSQKSKRRYVRIFRNHLLSKQWDLCIYIVKGESFRRRLMGILAHVKSTDLEVSLAKRIGGIYFCTLEDVQSLGLSAPMTNGKKEISFAAMAKSFGLAGERTESSASGSAEPKPLAEHPVATR